MTKPFKVAITAPSATFTTASINGGTISNVNRVSGSISGTLINLSLISGGSANFNAASINGVAITTGGGGGTPTNIAATTGTVGGWNISSTALTTGTSGSVAGLNTNFSGSVPVFFAGATDTSATSAAFSVSPSGAFFSRNANITSGSLTGYVNIFGGDGSGLHFNATTLTVTGGSSVFYQAAGLYNSPQTTNDIFIWSGSSLSSYTNAPFRVNYGGDLWARNAILTSASIGSNPIYTKSTAPYQPLAFSYTGSVSVYTSSARFYNDTGGTRSITSVRASVGSAPTGSAMLIDVRKNGTLASNTIFTGSSISIAATAFTSGASTSFNSGSSLAVGDYLTVAITQIGSTAAGSDLTVQVNWS